MAPPEWVSELQAKDNKARNRRDQYGRYWALGSFTTLTLTLYFLELGALTKSPINSDLAILPAFIAYLSVYGAQLYGRLPYLSPTDRLSAKIFILADMLEHISTDKNMPKKTERYISSTLTLVGINKRSLRKRAFENANAIKLLSNIEKILPKLNRLAQNKDDAGCTNQASSLKAVGQMVHEGNINSPDLTNLTDTILLNLSTTTELKPKSPFTKLGLTLWNQFTSNTTFRILSEALASGIIAYWFGPTTYEKVTLFIAALVLIFTIEIWQNSKKKTGTQP